MKDIIYYEGRNYTEAKQRQRILELSLFAIRSFIFVKMLKQHLLAVQKRLLS